MAQTTLINNKLLIPVYFRHLNNRVFYDFSNWVNINELQKLEVELDDETKAIIRNNLYIVASSIFESIPNDLREDNKFNEYINKVSMTLNQLIEHISGKFTWETDIYELFLFIAIIFAIRDEYRALQYLIHDNKFSKNILIKKSKYGANICMFLSISSEPLKCYNLLKNYIDKEQFMEKDNLSFNCLSYYASFSHLLLEYVLKEGIIDDKYVWESGKDNYNAYLCSIITNNTNSLDYIMNLSSFNSEHFNIKDFKDYTTLMIISTNNNCNNTYAKIINHKFCTQEFIEHKDPVQHKMAFHLAIRFNQKIATHMLKTNLVTENVFNYRFKSFRFDVN